MDPNGPVPVDLAAADYAKMKIVYHFLCSKPAKALAKPTRLDRCTI